MRCFRILSWVLWGWYSLLFPEESSLSFGMYSSFRNIGVKCLSFKFWRDFSFPIYPAQNEMLWSSFTPGKLYSSAVIYDHMLNSLFYWAHIGLIQVTSTAINKSYQYMQPSVRYHGVDFHTRAARTLYCRRCLLEAESTPRKHFWHGKSMVEYTTIEHWVINQSQRRKEVPR